MTSQPLNVPRRALLALLGLVVAGTALLGAPQAAHAAAFAIATTPGTLFPGAVTITGAKDAAATVEVGEEGSPPTCTIAGGTAPDPETWSCDIPLPDGNHTIAATQTTADAVPVVTTETVPVRVLGAPVITTTGISPGTLNGTGFPGAGIELSGDITKSCGPVLPNGTWACPLGVGTGTYSVFATHTWGDVPSEPGASSASVLVRVDVDPPALPAFASPAAGSRVPTQPTMFSGSGENGGRVEVFADSNRVCVSPVITLHWSCSASLTDGQHTIKAVQWDAAGNASGASQGFTITAGAAAPVTPPEPPREPAPDPNAEPSTPLQPVAPAPTAPFLPPPVGGESGMQPFDTWELPTDYGAAIPSVSTTNPTSWLLGLGLGLGFALLVALPLRLLVTTLRRKRGYVPREPSTEEPLLSPRVTAALFLGAAVLLAALAGGIQAEVRYLRLAIAIGLALAALNGVAVLVAKLAGRSFGLRTGIRLAPLLLGVAAVTALVSRVAGIQPPIIVGIVLAVRFLPEVGARARGVVSLAEVAAIVALGFVAWLGQSALGPVDGFFPSLVSEALSALTIAALGSAMVMLLPVNRMPGRRIWAWSRTAWALLTLVTATVAGVVIAGGSGFPVPWVIGGALVFSAVCLGVWAWVRLVEPQFVVRGGS
ncbi:MAG: hypothetical protein JWR04_1231 [Rhodoglobus sp.]|nr:hypothetical protein [Rhodoglobus sp.]